jgi:superfamily II DNA helicase RecQ
MVAYAVQADFVQGLSMRSVDVFCTPSYAWHTFLGLASVGLGVGRAMSLSKGKSQGKRPLEEEQACSGESRQEREQERKQEREQKRAKLSAPVSLSEATSAATLQRQEARRSREASLEIAVRKVLSLSPSSPVTYKSPEQKQALDAVVQGISPLIVVLPTGGGKTLLPLAAAVLDNMQQSDRPSVTMLVLPFCALIEDLLVRLGQAGIKAIEWQPDVHRALQQRYTLASVMLVSADYVGSREFLSYAARLAQQQILRRVVVDECHTAITADLWRPKLARLKDVQLLPCQIVLLTATLPPSQIGQLQEALLVRTATIVQANSTQRPRTKYIVLKCQRRRLVERAVQQAWEMLEEATRLARETTKPVKGIVYCRSRALCEQLAAALECGAYHAGVESRTEMLQDWRAAGGLIVCTSALGVGVDIPGVKFTLHVEQPWGMIDFVQESGRAREEGQAVILVVAQQSRLEQPAERAEEIAEEEKDDSAAIAAFVRTSGCRRAVMSRYMDSVQVSCREVEAAIPGEAVVLCDNCEGEAACRKAEGEQQDRESEQEAAGVERVGSG